MEGSVEEVVGDDVGGEDVGEGFSRKLIISLIVSSIALRDSNCCWIETKTSYSHHLLLLYLP